MFSVINCRLAQVDNSLVKKEKKRTRDWKIEEQMRISISLLAITHLTNVVIFDPACFRCCSKLYGSIFHFKNIKDTCVEVLAVAGNGRHMENFLRLPDFPSFSLSLFLSLPLPFSPSFYPFLFPLFWSWWNPKFWNSNFLVQLKRMYSDWNILDNALMIGYYGGNRSLPLGKYLVRRPCWLMFVHVHCRICLLCYSTPDFKLFLWRWIDYVDEPWLLCLKKFCY